jgi:hypothetical protein
MRDPETRRKGLESRIRNGTLIPQGGGRGITGFRKGIPHYCRSTLEANFARILIHEGVPYQYEPQMFVLPDGGRWTPDFFLLRAFGEIPAGWVETKGWKRVDGSNNASAKIAAFEAGTGTQVFVLCQQDERWRELQAKYDSLLRWERQGYNLRTHPKVFGRKAA